MFSTFNFEVLPQDNYRPEAPAGTSLPPLPSTGVELKLTDSLEIGASLPIVYRWAQPFYEAMENKHNILEIVLHITRNSAFTDAEQLGNYCSPYTM